MRVAMYIRCASPTEEEYEFNRQKYQCLRYAFLHRHEVVAVYEDYGQSGLNDNRPAFQEMLAAAKLGVFDALLVQDIARLSRVSWQVGKYLDYLHECGVSLIVTHVEAQSG